MSKGLEALHHPRIKMAKVDISAEGKRGIAYMFFDDTKQYAAIEKELNRLNELEKAFVALSKEDEKAKELLSLEIEKNRALEIIKETFKITFDDEELTIGIDDTYFLTFKDKTKYDLLKEVLL